MDKKLFCYFKQLVREIKVVKWFSKGEEFQFLPIASGLSFFKYSFTNQTVYN